MRSYHKCKQKSGSGVSQCVSLSGKLFEDNRTPMDLESWAGQSFIAVQEWENSHNRHNDTCGTGAFAMGNLPRVFFFCWKWVEQWKLNSNTTLPAKRLTTGQARGTVCVGSWAPWLTFSLPQVSFQHLRFNLNSLMLCHILILHNIKQIFWCAIFYFVRHLGNMIIFWVMHAVSYSNLA